jgi:hypothetical protein
LASNFISLGSLRDQGQGAIALIPTPRLLAAATWHTIGQVLPPLAFMPVTKKGRRMPRRGFSGGQADQTE